MILRGVLGDGSLKRTFKVSFGGGGSKTHKKHKKQKKHKKHKKEH